ncbi:hypothetical protein LX32DRAFT_640170 [Colletotrichum zoysiae]|uniref:Uncharacterized protein n=1 Tax=Colletotrichum zoysiae TaxID=1216348 RepID=A0AAD9HG45_9PEZI|nr:hypothetical protein LX32DRAFT_640170 [Colletotrichum zoysiae]
MEKCMELLGKEAYGCEYGGETWTGAWFVRYVSKHSASYRLCWLTNEAAAFTSVDPNFGSCMG